MPLLFPDTTVLVNFVLMARVDLFAELVRSNGAWTYTIAEEANRLSAAEGMEGLQRIVGILGKPILPTPSERVDALRIRERIAGPGDHPHQHHGEAETIAVMHARSVNAAFVTDDLKAATLARSPDFSLRVYTTGDLIGSAVRSRRIDLDTAWDMIEVLRSHGRARGMPPVRDRLSQWVYRKL